ncbi:MAG TPA: nucleotidyltransferase domain-containing protein [Anaerolineae bacterium]|nr:nucleotidyltransferase domain-containing protein [Anaerolineae bacterium]
MPGKGRRDRGVGHTLIPEELHPALTCFIDQARNIPNLKLAILFGSAVTGEFRKKSDIDILLLFDTDHNPELGEEMAAVSRVSSYVAQKYDLAHSFSFVMENLRDGQIDPHFLWTVAKEGIIIWGDPGLLLMPEPHPRLEPELLVTYSTQGLSAKDRGALHRALYGYRVEKRVRDKVYVSEKEGLIARFGRKLGPGVVMVPAAISDQLIEILEKHKAKYSMLKIWR